MPVTRLKAGAVISFGVTVFLVLYAAAGAVMKSYGFASSPRRARLAARPDKGFSPGT